MRGWGDAGAAIVFAVTFGCCGVVSAGPAVVLGPDWFWSFSDRDPKPAKRDADWVWSYPNRKADTPHKRDENWFWSYSQAERDKERRRAQRLMLFSGADLWRQGSFVYGGSLWAPSGFEGDGLVFKVVATRGRYRYRSGALGDAPVEAVMFAASAMPGARFTRNGVSASIYAGFDYQVHLLSPYDPGNEVQGRKTGVRIALDLWYQPMPAMMTALSGTLSTIGSSYALRAAAGWRILDSVFVGPEALIYGGATHRQVRVGAHITGLNLLWCDVQAAIGYAFDTDDNRGAYARLGVSQRW